MKQEDAIIELNTSDLEVTFGGRWVTVYRMENDSWVSVQVYVED